jgi:micrococcal nuclease
MASLRKPKQVIVCARLGKDVIIQTHGQDKHGRTLADVLLPDDTHVNHELLKDGWCWWYQKYAPKDLVLQQLEHEAREHKKGLNEETMNIGHRR